MYDIATDNRCYRKHGIAIKSKTTHIKLQYDVSNEQFCCSLCYWRLA